MSTLTSKVVIVSNTVLMPIPSLRVLTRNILLMARVATCASCVRKIALGKAYELTSGTHGRHWTESLELEGQATVVQLGSAYSGLPWFGHP